MNNNWSFSDTKINTAAFRALRKSPEAQAWVARTGRAIAAAASSRSGQSYDFQMSKGRSRARGVVAPASPMAARDSLRNLTLLKVLDAGRNA